MAPGGAAERRLLLPEASYSQSSVIVSVGTLLTALIGAGQALVLVFIVGESDNTDAFLAAYALYFVFAIFGGSLRSSVVPLLSATESEPEFRERVGDVGSRILVVALATAVGLAALSPLAGQLLTHGLPSDARWTAVWTLLILTPSAFCQIQAAALSATLIAARRFTFTTVVYVGSGAFALGCSAALLELVGVLGAALGLLAGSLVLLIGHSAYVSRFGVRLRPRGSWLRERDLGRLLVTLVAGAAIGIGYQASLAISLAGISTGEGAITAYSYAFFLITLMLAISSVPLALVTLPDLVGVLAREGRQAAEDYLARVAPYSFALLAPLGLGYVAFGQPLLEAIFSGTLTAGTIDLLYDIGVILSVMVVPGGLLYLITAVTLALDRSRWFLAVAAVTLVVHAVMVAALSSLGPRAVAAGHVGSLFLMAALLAAATFGRRWPIVTVRALARSAPAFALAAVFPLLRLPLGADPSFGAALAAAAAAAAAYGLLVVALWPSVGRAFADLIRSPWRTSRPARFG